MRLTVISQTKELFTGEVKSIIAPTLQGEIGVYPEHANIVTVLDVGQINIRTDEKEVNIVISGGFLQVAGGKVTILADDAEYREELVDKEIEEAIKKAEEKISSELPHADLIQAEKALRYEKMKKKVVGM